MSILSIIQSWFTQPRRFTDAELLAGPEGDCIDHGFHYTEEDYIRVLEHRKKANQLSERQHRILDIRIAHLHHKIADREAYNEEQAKKRRHARLAAEAAEQQEVETQRRKIAEEVVDEIVKKPTPSVRVPQSSGGSTAKFGQPLAVRVAELADSIPTHTQSPASHSSSPSHSVSYSSHKSCNSSSYDGGSSSSSSDSSSSGGCD